MTESFMSRFGGKLGDNGYSVIPIQPGSKKPGQYRNGRWGEYPGWSRHCSRETTAAEIEIWSTWPDAGIGVACGQVIAVDIDVADPETALAIDALARERLGDTPAIRIGSAPKRLLVYRADQPFAGVRASPIEILGLGQQFVAYAVHPGTGRPYEWPEAGLTDTALTSLSEISDSAARGFCDEAFALIPESLRPARLSGRSRPRDIVPSANDLSGTREAITGALEFLPNADLAYDEWVSRTGLRTRGRPRMKWLPRGYGGTRREPEQVKGEGWREQGILVIAANDQRLSWPERELIRQIGNRIYGRTEVGHG